MMESYKDKEWRNYVMELDTKVIGKKEKNMDLVNKNFQMEVII